MQGHDALNKCQPHTCSSGLGREKRVKKEGEMLVGYPSPVVLHRKNEHVVLPGGLDTYDGFLPLCNCLGLKGVLQNSIQGLSNLFGIDSGKQVRGGLSRES